MSNLPVRALGLSSDKVKVVLAVCVAFAGIVGFYFLSDKPAVMRVGVLIAGLIVSIVLVSFSVRGREFFVFSKEAMRETKKVVWPTRKEAMQITAIVFGFVLIMAMFLWGVDKLLEFLLYDLILGWKNNG